MAISEGATPGSQQRPHPAHGLDGLVIGSRCADGADRRCLGDRARDARRLCPSSQAGTVRGPAVHCTGICAASAFSSGRQQGDSSVRPTISIGPRTARRLGDAAACSGDNVDRTHHAGRKLYREPTLPAERWRRVRGWSTARAAKVDAGAPSLVQRVGGRVDHAGKRL